jgi:hypothetical protein
MEEASEACIKLTFKQKVIMSRGCYDIGGDML